MRLIFFALVAILIMIGGGAYYMSLQDGNGEIAITPTPTANDPTVPDASTSTVEPTPTDVPVSVGATHVSPESLASILSNPTYATLRLENYGFADFLVAQSNGTELFYLQGNGNIYSKGDASFNAISIRGMGVLGEMLVRGGATFNDGLAITQGTLSLDGDLSFSGPHTISGSGSLTINPTGNINFQSPSYYINESGKMVVAEIVAPKLSYSGDITIDANSPERTTTVTVQNSDPLQSANLSIEGDVIVNGGTVTFASSETIDAKTADTLKFTSDGNLAMVLGDAAGNKKVYIYDSTGTNDVFSVDSFGNVFADGNLNIAGSFTAATTIIASLSVTGDSTFGGNITVAGTATVSTLAAGTT
ncbi:hypothetical protein COY32_02555, partial [candidate division WWE3 bacterium CG_4_10_14_0_2_um_filter_41_14]